MIEKEILITSEFGLHARPAAKLVRLAAQYRSNVYITFQDNRINAKSIMGVMMLAAEKGARIHLQVEGDDEMLLMTALENLFNSGFGE